MKITVKPEGRKDIYVPDKESLKAWIKSKGWEYIHNFAGGGSIIIGADHDTESVLEDIDKAERVGLLANEVSNQNMGHALSLVINNKLECYDIGKITDEDLEVDELPKDISVSEAEVNASEGKDNSEEK